ncbi:hypothetical protein IHE45_08G018400 [Dioscorea alata]|uniref:Uncharacterized protein n=1 Tax=Dioscorea alata TaxID=55571 RepID=A0ACB7VHJ1_DIOAL|nr:hypothetical protein IHE45_08G018400 [Dioscorea alata]
MTTKTTTTTTTTSSKSKSKSTEKSMIMKIVKAPIRALSRARDLYITTIITCAGRVSSGSMAIHCPLNIPLSHSSSDDLRHLILATSLSKTTAIPPTVRRSQSLSMSRIDEDSPCDFTAADSLVFPRRSFSCSAHRRRSSAVAVVS